MQNKIKIELVKIIIFLILVNLPFISISQQLGIEAFYDSFEYPQSYQYFKNDLFKSIDKNYCIIQKTSHPNFQISEGDRVIFVDDNGQIISKTISFIDHMNNNYYHLNFIGEKFNRKINEYQILGKIIKNVDDTFWNKLSLKVWDGCINNLNVVALFSKN